MIARRHMYQYGTTREQLAAVAVKNHANGAKNPLAHMRKVITMEQALTGKPISEPLTVYDCSLISDGAAAVLIAPLERAAEFTDKPVKVLGIAQTSDYVALDAEGRHHDVPRRARRGARRPTRWRASRRSDIQFAEVHDCFTIAEIIATEDLGFVKKGEGGPYALAGRTWLTGERPINTSGGLKSKGHPVGATGVGQICDVVDADSRRGRRAAAGAAFAGAGAEPGRLRRDRRGHDSGGRMKTGIVYTETVVHAAPEQFVADAPYQLAIVSLEDGGRLTVRVSTASACRSAIASSSSRTATASRSSAKR